MSDESLENRVSIIKAKFRCDHRKTNDFSYHHYDKNGLKAEAHLCSQCLPRYVTFIQAYEKTINEHNNNDDDFDDDLMYFKDPT